MKKTLLYCALLFASATSTAVQFIDGNILLARLKGNGADPIWGMAYVVAVNDAKTFDARGGAKGADCFSTPSGVRAQQLSDIVSQWLERNPQERHYAAPGLVSAALASAYPCR